MQFIQSISGLRVDQAPAAALPAPAAAGDGVDITTWRKNVTPITYPLAAVALVADGNATVDNAALYGFGPYGINGTMTWCFISYLNNNAQIVLTAAVGFVQQIEMQGIFTKLAVGGTRGGAGNVGYTLTPMAVHQ